MRMMMFDYFPCPLIRFSIWYWLQLCDQQEYALCTAYNASATSDIPTNIFITTKNNARMSKVLKKVYPRWRMHGFYILGARKISWGRCFAPVEGEALMSYFFLPQVAAHSSEPSPQSWNVCFQYCSLAHPYLHKHPTLFAQKHSSVLLSYLHPQPHTMCRMYVWHTFILHGTHCEPHKHHRQCNHPHHSYHHHHHHHADLLRITCPFFPFVLFSHPSSL